MPANRSVAVERGDESVAEPPSAGVEVEQGGGVGVEGDQAGVRQRGRLDPLVERLRQAGERVVPA